MIRYLPGPLCPLGSGSRELASVIRAVWFDPGADAVDAIPESASGKILRKDLRTREGATA